MSKKLVSTTVKTFVVTVDDNGTPLPVVFESFIEATKFYAVALEAGQNPAMTTMSGLVQSAPVAAPAPVVAAPAVPVTAPTKSDMSVDTFRLVIKTKSGKTLTIKGNPFVEIKGRESADKYAARCRAQGKTVRITKVKG